MSEGSHCICVDKADSDEKREDFTPRLQDGDDVVEITQTSNAP